MYLVPYLDRDRKFCANFEERKRGATAPKGKYYEASPTFSSLCGFTSQLLLVIASGGDSVARRRLTSSKALAMDNSPNANIHTIVKAQIVFLLSTLTEDNFDRNQVEIRSVSLNIGFMDVLKTSLLI
jgi:hypothetical protein